VVRRTAILGGKSTEHGHWAGIIDFVMEDERRIVGADD